jgi:hypothetical protein
MLNWKLPLLNFFIQKIKVPGLTGNLYLLPKIKLQTERCQLELSFQSGGILACGRHPFRSFAPFVDGYPVGLDKIHGFFFAEPDTLRIPVTMVALEYSFVDGIKAHGPERTYANTRTAADADIIINGHLRRFLVARDGLDRADIQTGRVLALLTGHRDIQAFGLPFYHPDPASGGIGYPIM